jgi:predicted nucleic acid-binding protein
MIILDTNVASEPMRPACAPAVTAWFDRQERAKLYLTAINLSELLFGIALAPEGRRKQGLAAGLVALKKSISTDVLSFDEAAAMAYSELMARARAKGFAISEPDGQIAAIAKVRGFAVATRDVAPFKAAGVAVINPWEE